MLREVKTLFLAINRNLVKGSSHVFNYFTILEISEAAEQ